MYFYYCYRYILTLWAELGWMVSDGVSANDVAVQTVCHELYPAEKHLKAKQVQIL